MYKIFALLFLTFLSVNTTLSQSNEVLSNYDKFEDTTMVTGKSYVFTDKAQTYRDLMIYPYTSFTGKTSTKLTSDAPVFLVFAYICSKTERCATSEYSGNLIFLLNDAERLRFPINFTESRDLNNQRVWRIHTAKLDLGSLKRIAQSKHVEVKWSGKDDWSAYNFDNALFIFTDFISYLEKN